jgi:hypothetical protein
MIILKNLGTRAVASADWQRSQSTDASARDMYVRSPRPCDPQPQLFGRITMMDCAMCPEWMGTGMLIGTVVGVLLIVVLVLLILRLTRS